ncbi:hypothetical protein ONZ43_g7097 [Nemania bipapillata]|uniref:Uncharacterized protein n=1 Tax=Nemania bipapillata TaxID=110536 RepID=A0ACC2HU79_9PEZI|nr:hypothetical protein ONZ43_g7097 [Nemania bipapillata]
MRLLQRQDDGSIKLTKYFNDNEIPQYAILSHTWGADEDEVVFEDMIESVGRQKFRYRQKSGSRKIDHCAEWAAADGLPYFWVDSCCINKSNYTELQEAITSMFRWYQNAEKCYVYLPDVITDDAGHDKPLSQRAWESSFRRSRWFTRGWTLQELLAPRHVEFFSGDGRKLGSRTDLGHLLQEVTGIDVKALRGEKLSKFSISERMSWARSRQTKRKEDKAYSLFGIFDVSMYINYGEGEERAMDRLRREILSPDSSQPSQRSHFMVPFGRNNHFVGHDTILEQLLQKIPPSANPDDCQRTAIEGLGGIGKTQIALEAAYRIRDRYPESSVFWVPASDSDAFENAYREIGRLLRIRGVDREEADVKALVTAGLSRETAGSWLLIVDDADDLAFLGPVLNSFFPFNRKGSILFTTRNHRTAVNLNVQQRNMIVVPKMDDIEATRLLRTGLDESRRGDIEGMKRLLSFLVNLPLAIKQASAFLASNPDVTVSQYLGFHQASDADSIELFSKQFEDPHRYTSHASDQNPIARTWLISFKHISRRNPLAADYLKFMCVLAEKAIPLALLPVAPGVKMAEAMNMLKSYAFIAECDTPDTFDVHPLVRLVMRDLLQQRGEWVELSITAAQRIAKEYPSPKSENKDTWVKYLPHAQAVIEIDDVVTMDSPDLAGTVIDSYAILEELGESERLCQRGLKLREEKLGKRHPSTLECLHSLGCIFTVLKKHEEAEKIFREVLGLRIEVLGVEHSKTLQSMSCLSDSLRNQGELGEAETIARQTQKLMEKVLGSKHLDTLEHMGTLALILFCQERLEEAEEISRQLLGLMEEILGKQHTSTLGCMVMLASILTNQGYSTAYEEAEKILRQAVERAENALGRKNPVTLQCICLLASILARRREYEEATEMCQQAIRLTEEVLGKEHPSIISMMELAATCLVAQENNGEAEKMQRQALELRAKVPGMDNSNTLQSIRTFAMLLQRQEKYDEIREIIKMLERIVALEPARW